MPSCGSCVVVWVDCIIKKRRLSAYNLEKRAPVQWGITHEKTGVEEYCKTGGETVEQTGIWLHESGILGASPDGFVKGAIRTCPNVHLQSPDQPALTPDIIEVKCPFSARDITIAKACTSNKDFFLERMEDGRICIRPCHDYWHLIQRQLHLTGTQCCD